jgi:hypothetical protein
LVDWEPLITLLNEKHAELPGDEPTRVAYLNKIKAEIARAQLRDNDNKRAATLIAVDAAKTFVTIAIALFVAIVGFLQFTYHNVSAEILLGLATAATLALVSMIAGFTVIARAYKNADDRVKPKKSKRGTPDIKWLPWSTEYLSGPINLQALTGLAALLAFAVALGSVYLDIGKPQRFVVTLPDGKTTLVAATGPLFIEGTWSSLQLEQRGAFRVTVPAVPAKEHRALKIAVH